jgi:hypothetical protein
MRATVKKIDPEDYILSVLPPEDRLDPAFQLAREAFRNPSLTLKNIDNAVKTIRRKSYGKKKVGCLFGRFKQTHTGAMEINGGVLKWQKNLQSL